MKEELKVIYQSYVPEELILEFEKSGIDKYLEVEIKKEKIWIEETEYLPFSGIEIVESIEVFIQKHSTELLVGGVGSLIYDIFKGGLTKLWVGLSNLKNKKAKISGEEKSITVKFLQKDRSVEIAFTGDVDDKRADKIIDEALKYLSSERLDESFKNPDFIQKEEKPRIRLVYNRKKQEWEPYNYGDFKRKMEEIENRTQDLSS